MTAIELIFLFLRLILSLGVGLSIGYHQPFAGSVIGILLFVFFPKCVDLLVKCLGDEPRGKPVCVNHRCHNEDYTWAGELNGNPVCKCKCGTHYVVSGRRFMRVNSDRKIEPYMIWTRNKGWHLDIENQQED